MFLDESVFAIWMKVYLTLASVSSDEKTESSHMKKRNITIFKILCGDIVFGINNRCIQHRVQERPCGLSRER